MARQHFYSRVPAKVSLFNRMDGYDTFVHSAGVSREQIEKGLSKVYDCKPTKDDTVLIEKGLMPPIFFQYELDDGTPVQSAMSFIESDYTGERSSYMVHSLLFSDEERATLLENGNSTPFDYKIFKSDLKDFDITSFESKPITDYPELTVKATALPEIEALTKRYDAGMLKRLIYAVIGVATGKVRNLYISIPSTLKDFSYDCLDFLNCIISIIPYHLRGQISFATFASDVNKFSSFKIRCVPEKMPAAPASKGITIKMGAMTTVGVSDETIAVQAPIVDFFFGLLNANTVRKEFLRFADGAVRALPELGKPNIKNVGDLVFLFKALSGFFDENKVLPNDDFVYTLVATYEKCRTALPEEYRVRALDCLKRYPQSHTAIPKNVFSKVMSIYKDEPIATRHTAMSVVLDLIHTDAMRDKLFTFIKNNYDLETAETKEDIMKHICSVYYGGFLQEQIVEFFSEHFETEPAGTRQNILERLLLTVRTPKVQRLVLGFVDKFYDSFTDSEKELFYATFREMLPDGDELTRLLADIVDAKIDEKRASSVADDILKAVEADEKKHEPKLCFALVKKCGFTETVIAKKVFTDWSGRKIVDEFSAALCMKPLFERIDTVIEVFNAVPAMDENTVARFYAGIKENFKCNPREDVFALIECYDKIAALKSECEGASLFCNIFASEVLEPMIVALVHSVFDLRRYPDGIERIINAAKAHAFIEKSEIYNNVTAFTECRNAVTSGNSAEAMGIAAKIVGKNVRQNASAILKLSVTEGLDLERYFIGMLTVVYLSSDVVSFGDSVASLRDLIARGCREKEPDLSPDKLSAKIDNETVSVVLKVCRDMLPTATEEIKSSLIGNNTELTRYVSSYARKYDKKGKRFVREYLAELHASDEFNSTVNAALNQKSAGGGFLSRLFKKK